MSEKTERDANELQKQRHAPGEWSDEAIEATVKASPAEVVSFRLPSHELDALELEAQRAGVSLSQLIRQAIALRLYGQPIGPVIEVTSGVDRIQIRSMIVSGGRTEHPSIVSDFPPSMAGTS